MLRKKSLFMFFLLLVTIIGSNKVNAKFLIGVTKIKNMYLLIDTDKYLDIDEVNMKVISLFGKLLPEIKIMKYEDYKKTEVQHEDIMIFLNITTIESGRKSGKGVGYVSNLDINIGLDGFDELGSFRKIYWNSGSIIISTHKKMIRNEVIDSIEDIIKSFSEEWSETKSIFEEDTNDLTP